MSTPSRPDRHRGGPPLRRSSARPASREGRSTTADAGPAGLRGILRAIDGGPFQAYRRIVGEHELGDFRLTVLSVPSDVLAGPARLRLSMDPGRAGLDGTWWRGDEARLIIEDSIVRAAVLAIEELSGPPAAAAPGSGRLWVTPPGAALVERTTAHVAPTSIAITFSFDLPAVARRVLGEQAGTVLFDRLPRIGMAALLFPPRRVNDLKPRIEAEMRRRAAVRGLAARGLAAVIPSAALPNRVIPPGMRVVLDTDHGTVAGLGLPSGVTVLVGASASGAGAWLSALESEAGVSPGGTAMFAGPVGTIRATRRAIGPIDLSAFVHACPEVPQPENVHYDDAPAPLAAAASIVEAVEAGARVLLFDEDDLPAGALGTDGRMQRILGEHPSPVVPLVDRLADLRERWGVSIVIAARAIGDFFEASDTVLVLRDDGLDDATEASRRIARATSGFRVPSPLPVSFPPPPRDVRVRPADSGPPIKIGVWGGRGVRLGDDLVDLSDTPIVRDAGRLRAIAVLLKRAAVAASDWQPVGELLDSLVAASARDALAEGEEQGLCDLARPSRLEIAGALARWKRVEFRTAPVTLRRSAR